MEKTFIRVRSIKDFVIFSLLAIVGITLTVLPIGDAAHIAGFLMIFAALILAFVLKSAYKDIETNELDGKVFQADNARSNRFRYSFKARFS